MRLLALALWLCLCASPAMAVGLAIISGTGTNGAQQDPTFGAAATVTQNFTSSIPAGSLLIQIMYNASGGSTSTGFNCSDSQSNVYSFGQGVAALVGAAAEICYSYTTHSLTTSDTGTCTQISGPSGVVCQWVAFSGSSSTPYDSASATLNDGTSSGFTLTTGTLNGPCGSANCEVLIGMGTFVNSGTLANTTGYTNLAPVSGSRSFISSYKIVSATTAVSYTVTNSIGGNWAAQNQAFEAAVAGGASSYGGLTTTGVGP